MLFQTHDHKGIITRENAVGWYVLLVGGMMLAALWVPVVMTVVGVMVFAPKTGKDRE